MAGKIGPGIAVLRLGRATRMHVLAAAAGPPPPPPPKARLWVLKQRTRNGNALLLPAAHLYALLAHVSVIPAGPCTFNTVGSVQATLGGATVEDHSAAAV